MTGIFSSFAVKKISTFERNIPVESSTKNVCARGSLRRRRRRLGAGRGGAGRRGGAGGGGGATWILVIF